MTAIRRVATVTIAAAVAAGVAGCGNQISMNYSWQVFGVIGISAPPNGHTDTITEYLIDSSKRQWPTLSDKSGHSLPGTLFVERCVEAPATNSPVSCTVTINTGRQIYVGYSSNTPAAPDGTFTSLASSGSPDTIVVTTTDPQNCRPTTCRSRSTTTASFVAGVLSGSEAIARSSGRYMGLRASTISVSPGQSQKSPSGERSASNSRTSSAKASVRSANRWGAAQEKEK